MQRSLYELFAESAPDIVKAFLNTLPVGTKKERIARYVADLVEHRKEYSHRDAVPSIYQVDPQSPEFRKCYQSYYHLYRGLAREFIHFTRQRHHRPAPDSTELQELSQLLSSLELLYYRARSLAQHDQPQAALKLLQHFFRMLEKEHTPEISEYLVCEAYQLYLSLFVEQFPVGGIPYRPEFFDADHRVFARALLHWLWGIAGSYLVMLRLYPQSEAVQQYQSYLDTFRSLPILQPYTSVLEFFELSFQKAYTWSSSHQELLEEIEAKLRQIDYMDPAFRLSFLNFLRRSPGNQLERAMDAIVNDRLEEAEAIFHNALLPLSPSNPNYPFFTAHLIRLYFALDKEERIPELIERIRQWTQKYPHPVYSALADVLEVQLAIGQSPIPMDYHTMVERLETIEQATGDLVNLLSAYRTRAQVYYRFEKIEQLTQLVERLRQRRFKQLYPRIIRSFIRLLYYALHCKLFTLPVYETRLRRLWQQFRKIHRGERIAKAYLIRWTEHFVPEIRRTAVT